MATVLELLHHTLDNVKKDDLKRFRSYLKQNGPIGAGKLEDADVTDIVEIMMDSFGAEEAVKSTLNILRKMNQNQVAEELQNKYPEVQKSSEAAEKDRRKQDDLWLQDFLITHKMNMKEKVEHIFECKKENEAHLKDVFTELFIMEVDLKEVKQEHEILQIDDAIKPCKSQNRPIKCNDVFSLNKSKKIVLTKGIAGIGKTVSAHKFILDWAEGKANQDIDCVFLLPFKKINCIKDREISLHEFLQRFNPELKDLGKTKICKIYSCKLAFIFDGLDESRLTLTVDFDSVEVLSVEERSSVDKLFISLVNGTLLPSAHVWVTSRPAAANQIPPEYVGFFTEVRGFTDQQKEKYFRKRIKDETQASRMISHIKKSRSLYIMCYIPVFCWITATVLQDISIGNDAENNMTLTLMYIRFLLIQMNMKSQKCDGKTERDCTKLLDSNKTMILKLAKLAFEQLKNENSVFYEKDLKACGIDESEDFESTGMLTEIFQQEAVLLEKKVFCFVHLSVQEFLAAVHVFLCYLNKNTDELRFFFEETRNRVRCKCLCLPHVKRDKNIRLHDLLKNVVGKAMQSQKGHLDLFLRFLLGISLESNQKLLIGLFTHTEDSKDSITKTTEHITEQLQNHIISPETSVNLFYCLLELKDKSLSTEILRYFRSPPERELSSSMCLLMAHVLLMSEEVLDELNLNVYKCESGGQMRLLPAVRCCKKAILSSCGLDDTCCETVAVTLQIPNSLLIELDMSDNDLQDSGVKVLSGGLKSPNCQLNKLRLECCKLTSECCELMASVLQSTNSRLIELDMSHNELKDSGVELKDSGVKLLSNGLKSPNCQLKILRLPGCNLTSQCCEIMASVLQSSDSHLIELDISDNDLQDSGVKLLSDVLKSPNCHLEILGLAGCKLTDQCCESVASVLQSSNFCLIELDMSTNYLCDSGVKLLSDGLKSPNCQLKILRLSNCEVTDEGCRYLASALHSNPSHLIELDLSYNRLGESGVKMLSDLQNNPNCTLKKLELTPL